MNAKKIVIAGLFLGGGYYFIKNILPNLKYNNKGLEVDTKDYEDELAKLEADRLAFIEYQKKIGQRKSDGSYNKNWWLNTNIKLDKEALKNYEENINNFFQLN